MMGGLQSILQLGMAAIAIANFYSHISAMAKKLIEVIKKMAGGMVNFLHNKVGAKLVGKFTNPETRWKTIKNVIVTFVRVFGVLLVCLAAKLKTEIRKSPQEKL